MIKCNKCGAKNLDKAKFCIECGNNLKLKDYDEEGLKEQITSDMINYREWTHNLITKINEGNLPQSEYKESLKEAKSKTNRLIEFFKKNRIKLTNKNDKKLVDDRIKDLEEEITTIDKMIKNPPKKDTSFACPYCKREIDVRGGVQNKEMEIECELCHKKFKCITGVVSIIRGRINASVQYGPEPISITLETKEGIIPINFRTGYRFLITKGDKVSFIYLKRILHNSYRDNPSLLFNWDTFEVYRL